MMEAQSTELKILDSARTVFMKKGMAGARMQEIADHAGINKALLHYYYRNKEQLFRAVFREILKSLLPQLFAIFRSDLPLEVKVYQLAEKYIDFLSKHREMPLFVLNELQRDPKQLFEHLDIKGYFKLDDVQIELDKEVEKGTITPISAKQFMMNIISLMVFPFAARPMFENVFGIDGPEYQEFLNERKTLIPRFIMNALRP
jgi:AcrR family transcriptional regulator